MSETIQQIRSLLSEARAIFSKKLNQYGPSWIHFRPIGIADQIYIKGERIRFIEETGTSKVGESIGDALFAIINYTIIGEILLSNLIDKENADYLSHYDRITEESLSLLERKNTDYREAWREMDKRSLTDMILVKTARVKHILSQKTLSETEKEKAVLDQFRDIRHYALFRLIKERSPSKE